VWEQAFREHDEKAVIGVIKKMPYITKERRESLVDDEAMAQCAGELNFLITQEIHYYIMHKKLSYQTINDILGALEGAKLEFYRRVAVPYEEKKREANGDVY